MELDARTAGAGPTLEADVCIVGAGPVGLALAHELNRAGRTVVVLESGRIAPDIEMDALNIGETSGDAYDDLRGSRARGVGGTAGIWNTTIRGTVGAKYVPLDAIDLEEREWVPWSGWPFDLRTLGQSYLRAQAVCGLGDFDYGAETRATARYPLLEFGQGGLLNSVYQYGDSSRFRVAIPAELRNSRAVTLVAGATVVGLSRRSDNPIREANWMNLAGTRGVVRASQFVLAAGGIENARLLLAFVGETAGTGGTGGRFRPESWLGRGFMEHPIDRSLELVSRAPALTAKPGFYALHDMVFTSGEVGAVAAPSAVMGRITLAPERRRELKLPNFSVRLVRTARKRDWFRAPVFHLLIDLEQLPHRDNRVTLSNSADRLGVPQAALHWRWRAEDEANRVRIVRAVTDEFKRAGLGKVRAVAGNVIDPNAHHHMGATRMHADPEQGVVDADLRVHGEENLYVVGSSVFPTAGCANPTLTAIALAIRLGDRLAPPDPSRVPVGRA